VHPRPGEEEQRARQRASVISSPGLCRSSHVRSGTRPALTSPAREKAPVSSLFDQPSSFCIGTWKTAKA
jgi:hypothetical protein